uniref:B-cell receptor CD22 n=1 Tax=Sander lucioperca TaxID=283035 RepID=A0A8C9XDP2_SANLU
VEIHCSYRYPSRINATVERTFWFTKLQDKEPVDLRTDSKYSGRVQYRCHEKSCTLRISDLRESDSAEYKFRFITNQDVKYSGLPGVTLSVTDLQVTPPGDIMKNDSVTLTCSSDANPAAKYTWYKENQTLLSEEPQLVFSSIQSSDSGQYYCTAQNELGRRTSEAVFINVNYGPKLPSVSVSPSAEIVEGSSVNLTCSSDANPAANYTWYKENQQLLQGPESIYHFPSISSEDRGNYQCKSENQFGRTNSTSLVLDVQCKNKTSANHLDIQFI